MNKDTEQSNNHPLKITKVMQVLMSNGIGISFIRFFLLISFNLIIVSGPLFLAFGLYLGVLSFAMTLTISPIIMFAPFLGYEVSNSLLTFLCAIIMSIVGLWLLNLSIQIGKFSVSKLKTYFRICIQLGRGNT